ncbi:gp227 [Synechococcus phage syn9]|uniref:Gp227 n=1 Tax=Synechococcus phage syn9 TaxID=382359 RepID=Q0QYZ9_BPSYS|nr:gp227 [Synechococcus phage syn9]ABA47196.1 gp227 [Synechococcus phage syn9]AGH56661.1 hypothetical protein CPUG_00171 [Cyanophage Syn10]
MTIYFDKFKGQEEEDATTVPKTRSEKIGTLVGLLCLPVFFMLLWNWLMPVIFGLPAIGYFKSIGIIIMSRMLVGK